MYYPSQRRTKLSNIDRNVNVSIDGPTGELVVALGEKKGLPFQIHYEVEDGLLAPLGKMPEKYPKAKVIWAHLAQLPYIERTLRYSAAYIESLIKRFSNLLVSFSGTELVQRFF